MQANVRNYYMQFEESQTQSLIDSKIMEFAQHARPPSMVRVAASMANNGMVVCRNSQIPMPSITHILQMPVLLCVQPGMPPAMPVGMGAGQPGMGAPLQGELPRQQMVAIHLRCHQLAIIRCCA